MSNTYFRFKQFTIHQQHCAMKVTTDACLFGSLLPLTENHAAPFSVLDIGTGTGLLSLMYAQRQPHARIDAIEIEANAAMQAGENFAASPWANRLQLHHTDILQFTPNTRYDLIFSNPPFFENDLKSTDAHRNKALHDASLTLHQLMDCVNRLSKPDGLFCILLPWLRQEYFTAMAQTMGWHCREQINIRQTGNHGYFRSILCLSKQNAPLTLREITIKNGVDYTPEFVQLLKEFYLYL